MSKKDKKAEEKKASKAEKMSEKRDMILDTLDDLSDFCMDNILTLKPMLEDADDAVAEKIEERIFKFGSLIEVLNTVAELAQGGKIDGE
mgnify:CR=1 FL=1